MTEVDFSSVEPSPEEEYDPPKYSDKGRILFNYWPIPNGEPEIEVLDFDKSSVVWLNEGVGIEYGIRECLQIELELEGTYVIEGVNGAYYRGNWSLGEDDDEEWYFDFVRRAFDEEITNECLVVPPIPSPE